MHGQAYDAFNQLAMRLKATRGTEGPPTDEEVAQIAAKYLTALVEQLSEEDLIRAVDEFRAGESRMKQVSESIKIWLETTAGHEQEQEFKEFLALLNQKVGNMAQA
jgi:UDP-N-acetylmuramoylalanine-D-glutamate ligase